MTGEYQAGLSKKNVDFYTIKGIMEELLDFLGYAKRYALEVRDLPKELHPGQSARIVIDDEDVGIIGKIHPNVSKDSVFVMEVNLEKLLNGNFDKMKYKEISKYPNVVKDVAFVVNKLVKYSYC